MLANLKIFPIYKSLKYLEIHAGTIPAMAKDYAEKTYRTTI